MASKRYFLNPYSDYEIGEVVVDEKDVREKLDGMVQTILQKQGKRSENCDGDLYVGIAGVSYMFYSLSRQPALADHQPQYLQSAAEYMEVALQFALNSKTKSAERVGLLLGTAGVVAVAALLYNAQGRDEDCKKMVNKYGDYAEICISRSYLKQNGDELLVGRAGYLCGLLILRNHLAVEVLSRDVVNTICGFLIESGRDYAKNKRSPSPLMYAYHGTEYLGAAHGLSGILQMLLCFPDFLKADSDAEADVKGAVDFILSLQQPNGNFPCAMDEVVRKRPESEELVHWCHGAPGTVYLMAKAYLYWKDEKYLISCLKCGEIVWIKGLLRKGPGICHGVAGNGYVFLLLYRLTQDKKHLHRALKFKDFMFTSEFRRSARTPDAPYSLFEGLAGTCCYLADLLCAQKAEFPFFNVF